MSCFKSYQSFIFLAILCNIISTSAIKYPTFTKDPVSKVNQILTEATDSPILEMNLSAARKFLRSGKAGGLDHDTRDLLERFVGLTIVSDTRPRSGQYRCKDDQIIALVRANEQMRRLARKDPYSAGESSLRLQSLIIALGKDYSDYCLRHFAEKFNQNEFHEADGERSQAIKKMPLMVPDCSDKVSAVKISSIINTLDCNTRLEASSLMTSAVLRRWIEFLKNVSQQEPLDEIKGNGHSVIVTRQLVARYVDKYVGRPCCELIKLDKTNQESLHRAQFLAKLVYEV